MRIHFVSLKLACSNYSCNCHHSITFIILQNPKLDSLCFDGKEGRGKNSLLFILTEGKSGTQEATGQAVSTARPAIGMKYGTYLLVAWHSIRKL